MTSEKPKSLMRNLGEFFGHIAKGVKADTAAADVEKQEVRREVEEREETMPDGRKVTVRRTTIEEIEINEAHDVAEKPGDCGS